MRATAEPRTCCARSDAGGAEGGADGKPGRGKGDSKAARKEKLKQKAAKQAEEKKRKNPLMEVGEPGREQLSLPPFLRRFFWQSPPPSFGMGVLSCYPQGRCGRHLPPVRSAVGAGSGTGSSHPSFFLSLWTCLVLGSARLKRAA